jgi:hypothetical protein
LVDWTKLNGGMYALVAAVPVMGRAIPIYSEVHREKQHGTVRVERRFLKELARLLPPSCKPIVLTDAGFRNPWFSAVESVGWDYVGRLSGSVRVQRFEGSDWIRAEDLVHPHPKCPTDLGLCSVAKGNRHTHRVVFAKPQRRKPMRGRSRSHYLKQRNQRSRRKARTRAMSPWILATSLSAPAAAALIGLFGVRMELEETFRDVKNPRWGWSLAHARTKSPRRYEVLLLIAAFAMLAVMLAGIAAEQLRLHRAYQANTISDRRVLSCFVLGRAMILRRDSSTLSQVSFTNALRQIEARHQERVGNLS